MLDNHPRSLALRSKQILSAGVAGLIGLSSLTPAGAKDAEKSSEAQPMKKSFDLLEVLPEGSILRRVSLPQYDKDFTPTSLLTAETMTVLDESQIEGTDITINLYNEDGSLKARTRMQQAIYNQATSTLHASNAIFIEGDNFLANGTGLFFDLENQRGFLIGPVKTNFEIPPSEKPTSTSMKTKHAPKAIAGSLIALTSLNTSALAEPPAKLTQAQLEEFEQLAQPIAPQTIQQRDAAHSSQEKNDQLAKNADETIVPFLTQINQEHLLINTVVTPEPTEPVAEKEPTPEPAKEEAKPKKAAPVKTIKVTCEGGLYFDTDTNILAYLKNVHLEVENKFSLTCSDELKIFLDKKEAKQEKKDPKTAESSTNSLEKKEGKKADKKDEDKDENEFSKFGKPNRIIATGNVTLKAKDDKGKLFIATAEKASYDPKNEEMILSGGLPRIQLGPNQYLQSLAPGQYIRILKSGKLITEGKWTQELEIPNN